MYLIMSIKVCYYELFWDLNLFMINWLDVDFGAAENNEFNNEY